MVLKAYSLTASTRSGRSESLSTVKRKFMFEFDGDKLRALEPRAPVEAEVSSSAARIGKVVVEKNPFTGTWRLVFYFEPGGVLDADRFARLSQVRQGGAHGDMDISAVEDALARWLEDADRPIYEQLVWVTVGLPTS